MAATKLDLAQFYGTEYWYRHPIFQSITYTDGVKYVAETAGAYWLIDEIAGKYITLKTKYHFQCYELVVENNSAKLVITDGDNNVITTIGIPYTDFPESITMWCTNNTILLPSEY